MNRVSPANILKKTKIKSITSCFNETPYTGRRNDQIMHRLSSPASTSQPLLASAIRLALHVCERSRNYEYKIT